MHGWQDFDKTLGQRDSELLLSFLTVPYMRIPLLLSFFATEDRVNARAYRQPSPTPMVAGACRVPSPFTALLLLLTRHHPPPLPPNWCRACWLAVKSPTLRSLLDSVVFEPYRYLPKGASLCPQTVPTQVPPMNRT